MLKTKITRQALKHHFEYMGWLYIVIPLLLALFWSLTYTLTEYRPPDDKVLSLYLVGSYMENDRVDALSQELAVTFPQMEQIDLLNVPVEDANDMANNQRLSTYLYAGQGDVYIMQKELFEVYVKNDTFVALDGLIDTDIDLSSTTLPTDYDPEPHIYGIPTDSLYGLMEIEGYDIRDCVMGVMAFSTNQEESVALAQWIIDNRTAPKPEYIDKLTPRAPFFPDGFFDEIEGMY